MRYLSSLARSIRERIPGQVKHLTMPRADGHVVADGRPRSPVPLDRISNAEQLRRAIDSGATGAKIAMTDPAAAPLGSDEEASQEHDKLGLAAARQSGRRG
jgi:hypothetical protein